MRAGLAAPAAQRWLRESERPVLHNLYRRSLNLLNEAGELISLVLQELGPGPFALVVHPEEVSFLRSGGFAANLEIQDEVRLEESGLMIGELQILTEPLPLWNPRPNWEQVGTEKLRPALEILLEVLEQHAPSGSLAPLAGKLGGENGATVQQSALRAAGAAAVELRSGLQTRNPSQLSSAAGKLAGLGGGVTPSGDDFLMGAVHALWMLLEAEQAARLAEALVETAVPRTNRISQAWLRAAARGEAGYEWHVLVYELSGGGPLREAAAWLIRRGHTSGADAMAGFIVAAQDLMK